MDCDQYLELMSQALDGSLSPKDQAELNAHLAGCPGCRALFEALSQQSEALRSLDCSVPEDLHQKIMGSLPPQQPARRKGKVLHFRRWAALAACAALAVALGVAQPWRDTPGTAAVGPDTVAVQPHAYAADPRAKESAPSTDAHELVPSPTDTLVTFGRLPQGWEDVVDAASPDGAVLSGREALAFIKLLEEQGIPYAVEGNGSFSGTCQLILAED